MKNPFTVGGLMVALVCTPGNAASAGEKAMPTAPAQAGAITGKVVESMNAASYTYVLVDTAKSQVWAAAPQFPVKVGDTVVVADAMPMTNYHSKTLNRTFDVVYFSGYVTVNGAAPMAAVRAAPAIGAGEASGELPKGHTAIPCTRPA